MVDNCNNQANIQSQHNGEISKNCPFLKQLKMLVNQADFKG